MEVAKYDPTEVARAVVILDGQSKLARKVNASPQLVSLWMCGIRRPNAYHAIQMEKATRGEVSRHVLRPDIFGPAPTPRTPRARSAKQAAANG